MLYTMKELLKVAKDNHGRSRTVKCTSDFRDPSR